MLSIYLCESENIDIVRRVTKQDCLSKNTYYYFLEYQQKHTLGRRTQLEFISKANTDKDQTSLNFQNTHNFLWVKLSGKERYLSILLSLNISFYSLKFLYIYKNFVFLYFYFYYIYIINLFSFLSLTIAMNLPCPLSNSWLPIPCVLHFVVGAVVVINNPKFNQCYPWMWGHLLGHSQLINSHIP